MNESAYRILNASHPEQLQGIFGLIELCYKGRNSLVPGIFTKEDCDYDIIVIDEPDHNPIDALAMAMNQRDEDNLKSIMKNIDELKAITYLAPEPRRDYKNKNHWKQFKKR